MRDISASFPSCVPVPTAAPGMKCGCFSQRAAIRPRYSASSAGKSKLSGTPALLRVISSILSRTSAAATYKQMITAKGKE